MFRAQRFTPVLYLMAGLILALFLMSTSSTSAMGSPDVGLTQCANDGDGSNVTCANGSGIGWINANINASKGDYVVGQFYPNRQVFENLTVGNYYCFAVGFDYSSGGLPAVDYLGSYDFTLNAADPTIGTPFTLADVPNTIAIPQDPAITGGGTIGGNSFSGAHIPGDFTLWGGTFDAPTLAYSNPGTGDLDANAQQSIEYCFTATHMDAVLAFGAHIAVSAEWGHTDRPTGSPYHVSNGSRGGFFTAPRTGETSLVETLPDKTTVVSDGNIGRTEQQIQASAIEDQAPTAIALDDIGASSSVASMAIFILAILVAAGLVFKRFRKMKQ